MCNAQFIQLNSKCRWRHAVTKHTIDTSRFGKSIGHRSIVDELTWLGSISFTSGEDSTPVNSAQTATYQLGNSRGRDVLFLEIDRYDLCNHIDSSVLQQLYQSPILLFTTRFYLFGNQVNQVHENTNGTVSAYHLT